MLHSEDDIDDCNIDIVVFLDLPTAGQALFTSRYIWDSVIVDESLTGTFAVESMRKAAFVAVKSVERDASQRPTIAEVLAELKEAYSIQLSYLASFEHGSWFPVNTTYEIFILELRLLFNFSFHFLFEYVNRMKSSQSQIKQNCLECQY